MNGINIVRPPKRTLDELASFDQRETFVLEGYMLDDDGNLVVDDNGNPIIDWANSVAFAVRPLTPTDLVSLKKRLRGLDPFQVCSIIEYAPISARLHIMPDDIRDDLLTSDTEEAEQARQAIFPGLKKEILAYAYTRVSPIFDPDTQLIMDVRFFNEDAIGGVSQFGCTPDEMLYTIMTFLFAKGGRVVGFDNDLEPITDVITVPEVEELLDTSYVSTMLVDYQEKATDEDGNPSEPRAFLWKVLVASGIISIPSKTQDERNKDKAEGKVEDKASSNEGDAESKPKRKAKARAKSGTS